MAKRPFDTSPTIPDTSLRSGDAARSLTIVVVAGDDVRAWPLGRRGVFVIGRASDADVRVEAPGISRRHARIIVEDTVRIEDCGSQNGTFVRGGRLTENEVRALEPGEAVDLGTSATL